jgi:hypothetical protein
MGYFRRLNRIVLLVLSAPITDRFLHGVGSYVKDSTEQWLGSATGGIVVKIFVICRVILLCNVNRTRVVSVKLPTYP